LVISNLASMISEGSRVRVTRSETLTFSAQGRKI